MAEPAPGITPPTQAYQDPNDTVAVVSPNGQGGTVKRSDLDEALKHGFTLETPAATGVRADEIHYGDHPIEAGAEAALSTATFGMSRFINPERQRKIQGHNEVASMVGSVVPALAFGGIGAAGLIGEGGAAVGAAVAGEGAGLGARVAGGVAQGVFEGGGYGLSSGIEQVALSEKPMTWEGATATIGSNVLGGMAFGGVIGGGAKLLSEGASAAKAMANRQVEAITKGAEAEAGAAGAIPADVQAMDAKTASAAYSTEANNVKAAHKAANETVAAEIGAEKEGIKAARVADLSEGKIAQEAEVANLQAAKDEAARAYHQDAKAFKNELRANEDYFIKTGDKETARILQKSKLKIMGSLDNAEDFVTKRGSNALLEGLQTQKEALGNVLAKAEGMRPPVVEVSPSQLLDGLPTPTMGKLGKRVTLNGEQAAIYEQYADFANLPARPRARDFNVNRSELTAMRDAIGSGEFKPNLFPENQAAIEAFDQNLKNAQQLLEHNQTMIDGFKELRKPVTSEALTAIEQRLQHAELGIVRTPRLVELETKAAGLKGAPPSSPRMDHLKAHIASLQEPKGLGHTIAQGVGGAIGGKAGFMVGGPVGAVAGAFMGRDVGIKIFEKLTSKIVRSNAQRGAVIKSAIASMFAKGAGGVAKVLPSATKLIPAIQYATKEHADRIVGPDNMKPSKDATVTAFRQRARELNAVTEPAPQTPMGFQARMLALSDMHDRVAGLWQVAPGVANGVEKTQAAKWAFLASKLPRNPAPPSLQIGPDNWEPSKQQLSMFARYMEVAEDPTAAVTRLANGTITPGDVETLKAVWPGHYEDIRQQCTNHAATLQRTLPYVQRLNLSILLDVDVDPALTPAAMAVWQAPPPPPPEPQRPPGPTKPLPTGMVEPTQAQRMSSK